MTDRQLKPGRSKVDETREFLEANIIGQPQAIKRVCKVVATKISGLTSRNRPLAMIFTGPPAVGKTLTAKKLAETLGGNYVEIDMTEFIEDWKASKILGTGPGIVFGRPLITPDKLSKDFTKPTVILLDEFEKAHPEIRKIFIGILDDGKLTIYLQNEDDVKRGVPYPETVPVELDFSNTIVIITTNAGSDKLAKEQSGHHLGFNMGPAKSTLSHEQVADLIWPELKKTFGPELISRIGEKRTVAFNELTDDDIAKIIEMELNALTTRAFLAQNFVIEINSDVMPLILKKVREFPELGARNVPDVIESEITNKIAHGILSQYDDSNEEVVTKIHPGDVVKLGVRHGKKLKKGVEVDDEEVDILGIDTTLRQDFVTPSEVTPTPSVSPEPQALHEEERNIQRDSHDIEDDAEDVTEIATYIGSVISFWASQSLMQWRHSLVKIIREFPDDFEPELLARVFGDLYNFTVQFGPPRLMQFKQESKDIIVLSFIAMITQTQSPEECTEKINEVLNEELGRIDGPEDNPPKKPRRRKPKPKK